MTELQWKPQLTNRQAIEWTLEWFKHFMENKQSIAAKAGVRRALADDAVVRLKYG